MVIEKGFCDKSGCNNWPECNYQEEQRPPCAKAVEENCHSLQQLKAAIALVRDAGDKHLDSVILYEDFCRHLEMIERRAAV